MNVQEKLKILQDITGLTQTQLAEKIGVSFVAFNNWWTGKSSPRIKQETAIDELYKKYTGQKLIPESVLLAKKDLINKRAKKYQNILMTIISETDIYEQLLLSLTYNSNKIEGSTLSEGETAAIMNNVSVPNKSIIEHLEVKNHQTALQYLFKYLEEKKPINEELILKLHSILMNGIKNDAGNYRMHAVRIVGSFVPTTNHLKVPSLMKEIGLEISQKDKDVINQATVVHAKFEKIHPFSDGNGRIGRLIMTAMLLQGNIAPAVIKQESRIVYYNYLSKAQLESEYSPLEDFICDSIITGYEIVERK